MMIPRGLRRQIGILTGLLFGLWFVMSQSRYWKVMSGVDLTTYRYPEKEEFQDKLVSSLVAEVNTDRLERRLEQLSQQFDLGRYYNSERGRDASLEIEQLLDMIAKGHTGFEVERVEHPWMQPSLIFRIKGISDRLVIVGCHLDSLSLNPFGKSPGVDDDLTGISVLLEALNVFSSHTDQVWENTIEFHFYAAEELGFKGSQQIFGEYRAEGKEVIGMLQQDMVGFTAGAKAAGLGSHFGLVVDYASPSLMGFLRRIIQVYCTIGSLDTACSKICSDHSSALMYGYPGVFALESTVETSNPHVHSSADTMAWIDVAHMAEHVKLVVAFAAELGLSRTVEQVTSAPETVQFGFWDFVVLTCTCDTLRFALGMILCSSSLSICISLVVDFLPRKKDGTTWRQTLTPRTPRTPHTPRKGAWTPKPKSPWSPKAA